MPLDVIMPVVMGCALVWWVGRQLTWTARLVTAVVTLVLILVFVMVERSFS